LVSKKNGKSYLIDKRCAFLKLAIFFVCNVFRYFLHRSLHVKRCKKAFYQPDLLQFLWKLAKWQFWAKKLTAIFYLGQKATRKKTTGLPTFWFLHHTFFDNSASIYCKNLCLVALKRYFIEQNSKNEK
jgi:hypothetical protein